MVDETVTPSEEAKPLIPRSTDKRFLLIVVTAAVIVLALGGTFARLNGDDFCYAADAYGFGVIGSMQRAWNAWEPRYGYFLVTAPLYLIFGDSAPIAAVLLFVPALAAAWSWALRSWLMGVGIALALIWAMQPLAQTLYWLPAMSVYFVPLTLAPILWRLLCTTR
ncbi:MAG: hypothetical protein H7175_06665 [Burkholderiales bacterium]|nr:hypothetical protein [Anaerolineae bacterium]